MAQPLHTILKQCLTTYLTSIVLLSVLATNLHAEILYDSMSAAEKKSLLQTINKLPRVSGFAMHGEPDLSDNWSVLPYVKPKAPQGGSLKLSAVGTYDSLNELISSGTPAANLSLIYDSLTQLAIDEPFTVYGLVADHFTIPEDRGWAAFHINPKAKFHDGHPIQASDIVFTFKTLIEQGQPGFQLQFLDVAQVEALDQQTVYFKFKSTQNKELPLIVGTLPILPEHWWTAKDRAFNKPSLEKPLSSGPYQVGRVQQGKQIVYQRVSNYWANQHPLTQGRYNFAKVYVEYYLDPNIALEAFKSGEYTLRQENNSKFWATGYTGVAADNKKFKKAEIAVSRPMGMQGFVYNTRRAIFKDPILREAIAYAFDFDWSNENLFYGQYKRTRSYFENTELAATGLPSKAELKLLEPLKQDIPPRVFTEEYNPPKSDGSGRDRNNLRHAKKMLHKAGYTLKNKQLFNPQGQPIKFEVLLRDSGFERIVSPLKKNLAVLGIALQPKRVDLNQFIERLREYDYDMFVGVISQSLSPGNEQRNYWHSSAADQRDSRNYIGIKDKSIDTLINHIINAEDRDSLVTATRALDRVLQWNFFVIPNWHVAYERVAYWPPITPPKQHPEYNIDLMSWWYDQ